METFRKVRQVSMWLKRLEPPLKYQPALKMLRSFASARKLGFVGIAVFPAPLKAVCSTETM